MNSVRNVFGEYTSQITTPSPRVKELRLWNGSMKDSNKDDDNIAQDTQLESHFSETFSNGKLCPIITSNVPCPYEHNDSVPTSFSEHFSKSPGKGSWKIVRSDDGAPHLTMKFPHPLKQGYKDTVL